MVDKSKTIQESLAEVQRNAEVKKVQKVMNEWEILDEKIKASTLARLNKASKEADAARGVGGPPKPAFTKTGEYDPSLVSPIQPTPSSIKAPPTAAPVGQAAKPNAPAAPAAAPSTAKPAAPVPAAAATPSAPSKITRPVIAAGVAGAGLVGAAAINQSKQTTTPSTTPSAPSNATALAKDAQSKGQKILPSTGYDSKGAGGEAAPMSNAPKPSAPRQSAPAKPELDISAQKDRPGYGAYWGKHDVQTEDGLKKGGKKKVSESALINAFFELHSTKTADNVFEAAKKLSAKQKKIAKLAGDPDEIEAEDLAALRAGKK